MSRFTKKSNSILKEIEYQLIDEKENLSANEGIKKIQVLGTNKLGKLEDIEEELGIDLITLFNIDKQLNTKKEIWFKIEDEIEENLRFDSYYIIDLKHKAFVKIEYEPLDYLYFKDYGKTWALTKEELEDD